MPIDQIVMCYLRYWRVPLVLTALLLVIPSTGCRSSDSRSQTVAPASAQMGEEQPIAVNIATARTGNLETPVEYTGTTQPLRVISLRSQVEGRLLSLNADVGDRVTQGQPLVRLDDSILITSVNQAQAELAALEAQIELERSKVGDARTALERAKIELQQAENDAARFASLAKEGAIAQREAETAQTAVAVAQQAVRSAQERVRTEEKAVESALGRVGAQRSVLAQQQQRQSFAQLTSPITGVVLERISEPGDLVSAGGQVLKLGDFSQVRIVVPISELDLGQLQLGQLVRVSLDAFPNEPFVGRLERISPMADPTSRQVPVEVIIPNSSGQIGSGLLARVKFEASQRPRVVVPEGALGNGGNGQGDEQQGELFVLRDMGTDDQATVESRQVFLGDRRDGKVEILSGLQPGDRFVVNSERPLRNNATVRLSILSE
ncbi:efflux RND transporter periplasmic adaptor subunit [Spirulina subsalsa FACHB-351]|uniref:Efflux RND transporter periplasmic adaptor subunit n=2 Tax=Spirulina subsalsa TaxID=54311 RepID=A0ABT3L7L9_9CYAN|nr:efflux RND transporter periplasmic adaptor subunit [Spirulina subsalsa FACHB-351]